MLEFADGLASERSGCWRAVDVLTMFCVALRRDVVESVGPLDERFGLGLFEDDDYSRRVRAVGLELRVVEDAFVHHFGRATLDRLVPGGEYQRLFEENRRRFEEKWACRWEPAAADPDQAYRRMIERLHLLVDGAVEPGSVVAVLSRGDDDLLRLGSDRIGQHFPSGAGGSYAGHYPADGAAAIDLVDKAAGAGAEYLVVPTTATWWFVYYRGLSDHLARTARLVASDEEGGRIYRFEGTGRRR
jgi:hypothetical protein